MVIGEAIEAYHTAAPFGKWAHRVSMNRLRAMTAVVSACQAFCSHDADHDPTPAYEAMERSLAALSAAYPELEDA